MNTAASPIVLTTVGSFHRTIVDKLKRLGATVVVAETLNAATTLYRVATHVLLPGGADIHPANYNQPVRHANQSNDRRDAIELTIADLAIIEGKPLFGICRGHQVITVAAGGTLYQDIWRDTGNPHGRRVHTVNLTPKSLLAKFYGRTSHLIVNSLHHQAVKKVPAGWKVTARAVDGTIEGIGHPNLPVISVQWHPELMSGANSVSLFRRWLELEGSKHEAQV